jgi:hypothetical protein
LKRGALERKALETKRNEKWKMTNDKWKMFFTPEVNELAAPAPAV